MKSIHIVVFDFDGTLVLSNQLKYEAFFQLFPEDICCRAIVTEVLEEILEASRFVIIEEIISRIDSTCEFEITQSADQLADRYNDTVLDGAKKCEERQGAAHVLEVLHGSLALYVSSNTPQIPLREIIEYRRWEGFFKGVFGYPKEKYQTLLDIMNIEQKNPTQVLVVGDGKSDQDSAERAGCRFFHVEPQTNLFDVVRRTK